jgi:hypothetical protein
MSGADRPAGRVQSPRALTSEYTVMPPTTLGSSGGSS